jgi:hypothetical protein
MWSRVTGLGAAGDKGSLKAVLEMVTHKRVLNISEDSFAPIIAASHNPEDRPVIMKHLHDCLSEPNYKHSNRVYGALVLLEMLLTSGSLDLLVEIAGGLHFDLAQRLSFLDHFRCDDGRVQTMVKIKTEKLRKDALPQLEDRLASRSQERPSDLQAFFVRQPSTKTNALGLAYRNSKDFEDKFHGDAIAFYDSFLCGRDEGDGWLRVGELFLPIHLASGERVLVTFEDSSLVQRRATAPAELSAKSGASINDLMTDMLSDLQSTPETLMMEPNERHIQEVKKLKGALQKQAAPISYPAGLQPEVFGKSV